MSFLLFLFISDQAKCEAEAAYMAKHDIRGHVFNTIGAFEGVGFGRKNPPTCAPRKAMRLTGDASVQGPNGMWYRVRSWR